MARKGTIHGIECHLRTERARRAVRAVLNRIREIDPVAYERIQIVLWRIGPIEDEHRTQAQTRHHMTPAGWIRGLVGFDLSDPLVKEMQRRLVEHECEYDCIINSTMPNEMLIDEILAGWELPAVIAHELGHVATTDEDLNARRMPDGEWESEMCADFYAHKWGYGRGRERYRDDASFSHHGPRPGSTFEMQEPDGKWWGYRVDEGFTVTRFDLSAERIEELEREWATEREAKGIGPPTSD